MQPPLSGEVLMEGAVLSSYPARALAQKMSLVLTQRVAVGVMPVRALVGLGRHPYTDWTGKLQPKDEEAVWQAIVDVGIEPLANRSVCELSDGERQKVMIARALAQHPQVMILDEATAFLDLPRRVELMSLLRGLAHAQGRAVLLSTHDLDLALRSADRIWLLPPGGPLRQGSPEDLVLCDAFRDAFSGSDVKFDKRSGAFRMETLRRGRISIVGDDIPAMWTFRALERAGYQVVAPGAGALCVEVRESRDGNRWWIHGAENLECRSVEAVLNFLEANVPGRGFLDRSLLAARWCGYTGVTTE
jgi:iron complex transport system ATP-binding protein